MGLFDGITQIFEENTDGITSNIGDAAQQVTDGAAQQLEETGAADAVQGVTEQLGVEEAAQNPQDWLNKLSGDNEN